MRQFVFVLTVFWVSTSAVAARVVVHAPCDSKTWLDAQVPVVPGKSLGFLSVTTLTRYGIPFIGTEAGLHSIRGTVTGDKALEVVSNRELRAYGWCFHLNGKEPAELADQVFLQSSSDTVQWFFAYAHYLDGKWVAMCVPTHVSRPSYVCPRN